MFNGHMDTNPVTGGWTVDPFGGIREDEFIYAIGVVRGAPSPEFHDWRPPQVADFVRMAGTVRYGPSQSEVGVLADIRRMLVELEAESPGLKAKAVRQFAGERPSMLPFEVDRDIPDDLDMVRIDPPAVLDMCGADG